MYSGLSPAGSIELNSMAISCEFIIVSLAEPGWTFLPWISIFAEAALKVSYSSSPRGPPSTVKAKSAPNFFTSNLSAPLPISSSGVKAIFMSPYLASLSLKSSSTAEIIMAMPALSSAPKSVVPSVVMIVSPFKSFKKGKSETDVVKSSFNFMSHPS